MGMRYCSCDPAVARVMAKCDSLLFEHHFQHSFLVCKEIRSLVLECAQACSCRVGWGMKNRSLSVIIGQVPNSDSGDNFVASVKTLDLT